MDLVPPDFYRHAACIGAPPELFFDPDNETAATGRPAMTAAKMARRQAARAYCERCPVTEACLEIGWACSEGMFGGLDKDERRRIVRRRRKNEADVAPVEKPEEMSEEEHQHAMERAADLLARGKGVRQVMEITGLGYQPVVEMRNRLVMADRADNRWIRPEPPRTWGPGTECYQFWERRWIAGQYLGQRPDGKILVQSKQQGPTVRRWCDPEDVVIRPDVQRYQALRGNRKDLNVPSEVGVGGAEASTDAA